MGGGLFLQFLGLLILYVYEVLRCFILKKEIPSFKKVWFGKFHEKASYFSDDMLQMLIGAAFIILIVIANSIFFK